MNLNAEDSGRVLGALIMLIEADEYNGFPEEAAATRALFDRLADELPHNINSGYYTEDV